MQKQKNKCVTTKKKEVDGEATKSMTNIHQRVEELSEMMKKDGYI